MKLYSKVNEDVRLKYQKALSNYKKQKEKRNELLQEIGVGPNESAFSKTMGTLWNGSGSECKWEWTTYTKGIHR